MFEQALFSKGAVPTLTIVLSNASINQYVADIGCTIAQWIYMEFLHHKPNQTKLFKSQTIGVEQNFVSMVKIKTSTMAETEQSVPQRKTTERENQELCDLVLVSKFSQL